MYTLHVLDKQSVITRWLKLQAWWGLLVCGCATHLFQVIITSFLVSEFSLIYVFFELTSIDFLFDKHRT